MSYLAPLACALCCLSGPGQEARPGSYLHHLAPGPDGAPRHHVEAYTPQPGDLVFFDDHNRKWEFLYKVCGSGPPFHSGIVFALPDGTPGLLESGPDDTLWVRLLDGVPRLQSFKGDIWIRRVKSPLTRAQSARLTEFALAQDGKRYALGRLLLQGTPVKCRGILRCNLFGKTRLDRSAWLCSELVVAAGTAVGLFDPDVHFANAIYPRDIIVDNARYDIGGTFLPAVRWTAWPDQVPETFTPR